MTAAEVLDTSSSDESGDERNKQADQGKNLNRKKALAGPWKKKRTPKPTKAKKETPVVFINKEAEAKVALKQELAKQTEQVAQTQNTVVKTETPPGAEQALVVSAALTDAVITKKQPVVLNKVDGYRLLGAMVISKFDLAKVFSKDKETRWDKFRKGWNDFFHREDSKLTDAREKIEGYAYVSDPKAKPSKKNEVNVGWVSGLINHVEPIAEKFWKNEGDIGLEILLPAAIEANSQTHYKDNPLNPLRGTEYRANDFMFTREEQKVINAIVENGVVISEHASRVFSAGVGSMNQNDLVYTTAGEICEWDVNYRRGSLRTIHALEKNGIDKQKLENK